MPTRSIAELLNRTLVVVAHPDDECIGAGALMQRIEDCAIVFCTDGAPRDAYFWQGCGSREQYALLRHKEAKLAAEAIGVRRLEFLSIIDRELYLHLADAHRALEKVVREFRPDAILSLAYEGGHPDHDCCAFLSNRIAARDNIAVWEMALYHRTRKSARQQRFLRRAPSTHTLQITANELARKHKMASAYRSQSKVLAGFDLQLESFRPLVKYDFSRPPAAVINYEAWQWPVTAANVCRAFAGFRTGRSVSVSGSVFR